MNKAATKQRVKIMRIQAVNIYHENQKDSFKKSLKGNQKYSKGINNMETNQSVSLIETSPAKKHRLYLRGRYYSIFSVYSVAPFVELIFVIVLAPKRRHRWYQELTVPHWPLKMDFLIRLRLIHIDLVRTAKKKQLSTVISGCFSPRIL